MIYCDISSEKGRERAAAKAQNEYGSPKTAPATSWLFDIVRACVVCATETQIVLLYRALEDDPNVEIVRTKNRFNPCVCRKTRTSQV